MRLLRFVLAARLCQGIARRHRGSARISPSARCTSISRSKDDLMAEVARAHERACTRPAASRSPNAYRKRRACSMRCLPELAGVGRKSAVGRRGFHAVLFRNWPICRVTRRARSRSNTRLRPSAVYALAVVTEARRREAGGSRADAKSRCSSKAPMALMLVHGDRSYRGGCRGGRQTPGQWSFVMNRTAVLYALVSAALFGASNADGGKFQLGAVDPRHASGIVPLRRRYRHRHFAEGVAPPELTRNIGAPDAARRALARRRYHFRQRHVLETAF